MLYRLMISCVWCLLSLVCSSVVFYVLCGNLCVIIVCFVVVFNVFVIVVMFICCGFLMLMMCGLCLFFGVLSSSCVVMMFILGV